MTQIMRTIIYADFVLPSASVSTILVYYHINP